MATRRGEDPLRYSVLSTSSRVGYCLVAASAVSDATALTFAKYRPLFVDNSVAVAAPQNGPHTDAIL